MLQRYWGFSAFRPLQERVVRSLLQGRDTCVVMPTGGGKSLCYQLPALVSEKTAIVISPLIALMQDQAAQLAQMGIPAAFLNSTLAGEQQSEIARKARSGEYRLLYLSPERLARADTVSWLQQVPIAFFAIDEAHCISEWGHDFRPDYRLLSRLRANFPNCPIAAFTASATKQVRHDILHQLQLRKPDKYIASFHRPNLRYLVKECKGDEQMHLLAAGLKFYHGSNVIVYSPTIARVDETVDFLEEQGIAAIGYHGKMEAEERRINQERWMSDEVRVLVGTIAFGLGINKAAVRAVIHLSLPKSIEQYYQEAGRAGRDGDSADCVLLWQKKDAGLLAYFIDQIGDAAEKERAWQRYHTIRDFVDAKSCRHHQICKHFGETPKWSSCNACDVCGKTPDWMTTPVAPKTKRSKSSFERSSFPHTASSLAIPLEGIDPELREYLRQWRRDVAREEKIAAFIVMHDTSLDEICRRQPSTLADLRSITGFGERKTEAYGPRLLEALRQFGDGARPSIDESPKTKPARETIQLLAEGRSFEEIAAIRGRQLSTIVGMVATLIESGQLEFQPAWVDQEKQPIIRAACDRLGVQWLKPLKEALPAGITFDEIRLIVAQIRRLQGTSGSGDSSLRSA